MQTNTRIHKKIVIRILVPGLLVALVCMAFLPACGNTNTDAAGDSEQAAAADPDDTAADAVEDDEEFAPETAPAEAPEGEEAEESASATTQDAEEAATEASSDTDAEGGETTVAAAESGGSERPPDMPAGERVLPEVSEVLYVRSSNEPVFHVEDRTEHPPLHDGEEPYVNWMLDHTNEQEKFLRQRWERAQVAIAWDDVHHDRILEGFLRTPREHFCREWNLDRAYAHAYLGIGYGQTISGPHIVIRMTDYLNPMPEHKVLEIGTGSGYQSAFLAQICNNVYTIEIVPELARGTNQIYTDLTDEYPMYGNISRKLDDGYYGWEAHAPFDRIIVTCGIDHIPPDLLKQLSPEGIMVIPVGPPSGQTILKITKHVDEDGTVRVEREDIYHGRTKDVFVPFTKQGGGTHYKGK